VEALQLHAMNATNAGKPATVAATQSRTLMSRRESGLRFRRDSGDSEKHPYARENPGDENSIRGWAEKESLHSSESQRPPESRESHSRPPAPASNVTILRHCRCRDCRKFSKVGSEYFCQDHIGGTAVVWATGERVCDPPPDAWHYCAGYGGPLVSKDVWTWPRARTSAEKRPAPGGGGPGSGLTLSDRPGENRSDKGHYTPGGVDQFNADVTPRGSRQVPPGSTIAPEAGQPDEDEVLL